MNDSKRISGTEIKLRRRSRVLEVTFDDWCALPAALEYLRVYSLGRGQGHGRARKCWCSASKMGITAGRGRVGQYAVKLVVRRTAHDSGCIRGSTCASSGEGHAQKWARYQQRVQPQQ